MSPLESCRLTSAPQSIRVVHEARYMVWCVWAGGGGGGGGGGGWCGAGEGGGGGGGGVGPGRGVHIYTPMGSQNGVDGTLFPFTANMSGVLL